MLEETREAAHMRNHNYQRRIEKYYNARVKTKTCKVGNLVLCKNISPMVDPVEGKLHAKWEGQYKVVEIYMASAFPNLGTWLT